MTSYLKSTEKEFTIGKTGTIAGIYDRFVNFYSKEGYEFLIGIIIITRHNLPANAVASLNNQQMLTLTLESLLIHYFAYIKPDNRLDNKSLTSRISIYAIRRRCYIHSSKNMSRRFSINIHHPAYAS